MMTAAGVGFTVTPGVATGDGEGATFFRFGSSYFQIGFRLISLQFRTYVLTDIHICNIDG